MSIEILSTRTAEEIREAVIIIADGGNNYLWVVGGLPLAGDLQTILETREAELLAAVVAAGIEPNAPEVGERRDFSNLVGLITNELVWLDTVRTDIAGGIAIIDGGATLAQLRQVVRGLALIVDRMVTEQERELKAWRYVIRRLIS